MREATVKAMVLIGPKVGGTAGTHRDKSQWALTRDSDFFDNDLHDGFKLASREMEELLRHFARTQMDEVPGIRTNTTICLGRLAQHLDAAVRPRLRRCRKPDKYLSTARFAN